MLLRLSPFALAGAQLLVVVTTCLSLKTNRDGRPELKKDELTQFLDRGLSAI